MPALTITAVAESAQRAAARIAGLVRETPLDYSPRISEECAAEVWFKLENLHRRADMDSGASAACAALPPTGSRSLARSYRGTTLFPFIWTLLRGDGALRPAAEKGSGCPIGDLRAYNSVCESSEASISPFPVFSVRAKASW